MDDVGALKAFIDDNEDLERLEAILDQFNLFESLGLVRHEIRHSAFLRWLLDPSETHGLGDYFLRQFLQQVIKAGDEVSDNAPTLFDLDGWNLGKAEVRKEWRNMDIFIRDDRDDHQFVCVIENKVDSGESPGQLCRYRKIVEREFIGYKKSFVFLTIAGDAPSDDAYIPIGYGDLVSTIETALQRRQTQLNDEIRLFVQQYLDMVRRHIVEDSDIQRLCRNLYQNHRRALDLIFEHRMDRAAEVYRVIQDHIRSREDLISLRSSKTYIKFLPQCMDVLPYEGIDPDNERILPWLLVNGNGKLHFKLEIGPGSQQVREQVYEKAKTLPRIFGKPKTKLSPKYHTFFSETWITTKDYEELDEEGIKQRLDERIGILLESKGMAIADALKE